MTKPLIYLAGPDVFLREAAATAEAKRKLCTAYGFIGLSPVDNDIDVSGLPKRDAALRIAAANEDMIRSCNLVIANVTPFRGVSADVGTAYEMGFARALGRPVFAYTNVAGSLLARLQQEFGADIRLNAAGRYEDADDMAIEDFDAFDNLMLVGAIEANGLRIVVHDAPPKRRHSDLAGFEACLKLAAKQFNIGQEAAHAGPRA